MALITHHNDNSNEEVSEDEVADEDEGDGEDLTTSVAVGGELSLQVCPAISLDVREGER